jgi:hypothetical protein
MFVVLVGLVAAVLLVAGCGGSELTPGPTTATTPTSLPATATPDPCLGWTCTLRGVVYAGSATSGSELANIGVVLSHVSYCSPTRGQHQTRTGPDGGFAFEVFVHDTDTFWIEVQVDGYEEIRQSIGGFDCLYCTCPLLEVVLKPLALPTAGP